MTAVKVINEYIEFDTSSYTFRVPISDNINATLYILFFSGSCLHYSHKARIKAVHISVDELDEKGSFDFESY